MSFDLELIFQLALVAVVGLILGFEREIIGKPAGACARTRWLLLA